MIDRAQPGDKVWCIKANPHANVWNGESAYYPRQVTIKQGTRRGNAYRTYSGWCIPKRDLYPTKEAAELAIRGMMATQQPHDPDDPGESFDGGYHLLAKERHRARVSKTGDRVIYAVSQLEAHGIEYTLKNESIGHFHCRRKSDGALIQFWAGTGKIIGHEKARGIHALIKILDDMR